MIRRDIQFPGEPPQWLIISQIEHARLSRVLAESAIGAFPTSLSNKAQQRAIAEMLHAIDRHDDGWVFWEAAPKIDPEHHRPYGFTELPRDEVLPIWSQSIEVAAQIGPLAAWMVAGHFVALLEKSDDAQHAPCVRWHDTIAARRPRWLAAWKSQCQEDDSACQRFAAEALHWLQIYDEISLWLCCAAPIAGEERNKEPQAYKITHPKHTYTLSADQSVQPLFPGALAHRVLIAPWEATISPLLVQVQGYLVPQKEPQPDFADYQGRKELIARWLLQVPA